MLIFSPTDLPLVKADQFHLIAWGPKLGPPVTTALEGRESGGRRSCFR